jgi:hypothetical protein
MRRTLLFLVAGLLLTACAGSARPASDGAAPDASAGSSRTKPGPPGATSTPAITMCAVVMKATYGGQTVGLGDCAALVGLRPTPRIGLQPGERLTLQAPIENARPPVPTTTDRNVLRLVSSGSGSTLAVYVAGRPGTARLVIDHPAKAVCVTQPASSCLVATVTVAAG